MNILLTGGAGYIGSHTAVVLSQAGHEVVLLDIYAAREDPEPGVTGELILNASSHQEKIHYVKNWSEASTVASKLAGSGDFIVTMGCGDVYKMVPEILEALEV